MRTIIITFAIGLMLLSACTITSQKKCGECPQFTPPGPEYCRDGKIVPGVKDSCGCQLPPGCDRTGSNSSGLANPASVYCGEKGGSLEIKTNADGSQYGLCTLPDGTVCDEWAYYRNECPGTALQNEKSCSTNEDCACGKHITTGDCFFGNKQFVDVEAQCPDFCTGIGGNLRVVCENRTCVHKTCQPCPQLTPPGPDFCREGRIAPGAADACGCQQPPTCEQVFCPADAKECPDGTYVGRKGPDCEFAPCP